MAAVRAETVPPLPPPSLKKHHHLRATTTPPPPPPPPRWLRRHSIRTTLLPPLLQRPQLPPPTPLPAPEPDNIAEDQDCSSTSAAPASDVLSLIDTLHLPVDTDFYLTLLKDCTDTIDAAAIHSHIQHHRPNLLRRRAGLLLANRLLLIYTTFGQLESARNVFDKMPVRNAISWATMIAALSGGGSHREAMRLFVDGWSVGKPDVRCFAAAVTTVLRSCSRSTELGFGQQVHALVLKMVADGGDHLELGGPLMQFYIALGHYGCSQSLRGAPAEAGVSATCCEDDGFEEAFYMFREIVRGGGRKRSSTFSSLFAACAKMEGEGRGGRQVHGCAIKVGVESDQFVASSLVGMYAKCGLLEDAMRAFEETEDSNRDMVCWNAMLSGYAQRGCCTEAIRFLYDMKAAGVEPRESVIDKVRKVCSS